MNNTTRTRWVIGLSVLITALLIAVLMGLRP
jgi:hypothetical protein